MKNRLRILLLALSCVQCWLSPAQINNNYRYFFTHLDVQNGLPNNTVNAILQDQLGFVWFGTKDGLCRYDGISFHQFRNDPNDPQSLGNNFITSLYQDQTGLIWIGTDAGAYIYDPHQDIFSPLTTANASTITHAITSITEDCHGDIWLSVEEEGLYRYSHEEQTCRCYDLKKFPFIQSNAQILIFDNNNTLWLGCYGDGLFYSTDGLDTLHQYTCPETGEETFAGSIITQIIKGPYNCLYIGSQKGIHELNLTSGIVRDIIETRNNLSGRALLLTADGELWIGGESGIYIYNIQTRQYKHLSQDKNNPFSLSSNAVYALCQDNEGGVFGSAHISAG